MSSRQGTKQHLTEGQIALCKAKRKLAFEHLMSKAKGKLAFEPSQKKESRFGSGMANDIIEPYRFSTPVKSLPGTSSTSVVPNAGFRAINQKTSFIKANSVSMNKDGLDSSSMKIDHRDVHETANKKVFTYEIENEFGIFGLPRHNPQGKTDPLHKQVPVRTITPLKSVPTKKAYNPYKRNVISERKKNNIGKILVKDPIVVSTNVCNDGGLEFDYMDSAEWEMEAMQAVLLVEQKKKKTIGVGRVSIQCSSTDYLSAEV
jgi:hypothetical protein